MLFSLAGTRCILVGQEVVLGSKRSPAKDNRFILQAPPDDGDIKAYANRFRNHGRKWYAPTPASSCGGRGDTFQPSSIPQRLNRKIARPAWPVWGQLKGLGLLKNLKAETLLALLQAPG